MSDKTDVLKPFIPSDPLMAIAWVGAIRAAITNNEMVEQFRSDTGNRWQPPQTQLDQMIDEATGADADFIRQFAKWFNENVWGGEDSE